MNDISKARFEALAAYCRQPGALIAAEEIRWLEAHGEAMLIVIIRDVADGDYAAMVLARDLKERYRWVEMTPFFDTVDQALATAPEVVERVYADLDKQRTQGDEKGRPVDFFMPVVPKEKLNRDFATITALEGYSPAVDLMKPMMRWYEDADGNFVEQFQTTGFDTRLWELYIFAMLVEAGYVLDRSVAIPDFQARNAFGEICVEATTVNPSRDAQGQLVPPPPLDTEEQVKQFEQEYMPIRFAGPLTAKLAKKYWEKPSVQGHPLLFAIQDFHAPMSMLVSRSALPIYLYGMTWGWHHDANGKLVIAPLKVDVHRWGTKNVQSGFFNLPGAENVSAIIANASATISKFNRMGVLAGFGSKRVRLVREGTAVSLDPNAAEPLHFVHDVNAPGYSETWMEGADVFHNPSAKHRLDPAMLPGAAHHRLLENGQLESRVPAWQPFASTTRIFVPNVDG
ncbi:hypothetical protein [Cupriavidus basilensis]|uniref:Glycosaminoglycan attachment site n=1 Tax=Cupriavidus basilensis TaxID=68895 RepID=A0A0C4YA95_9BURK|nr:hypothetical protein [Cupriavidus basilensis]AJG17426.1 Glycosaminoglycan attachment site [Cupriavidus basilensis]